MFRSKSLQEVRWEAVGTSAVGSSHVDRYILHHSTYLEMPLLHFHNDEGSSKGIVVWLSLHGKATERDWPQITGLLHDGYEAFSFDLRGLGELAHLVPRMIKKRL
jgi:hypothetical protein